MNLKIKDVKVHLVRAELPEPSPYPAEEGKNGWRYLGGLRIISDEGLEGNTYVGTGATDNPRGIVPLVETGKPFLLGRDPLDREWLWHRMREMVPRWDVSDATIMAVAVAL